MRVLVTGAGGMVGSNVCESLHTRAFVDEVIPVVRGRVDLRSRDEVDRLLDEESPDLVIHAAAKVGGVGAKVASPTPYLLDNLQMDSAVIGSALEHGVGGLLYIGSAAVYPAEYVRPFTERDVLTGSLELVNEGYAIAKAAGARLCQYASREHGVAFRAVLPSNLYGPRDHFDPETAHLVSAALSKVHRAQADGDREVVVWGDGTARREFTYVGDLSEWIADALPSLKSLPELLNLGTGVDHAVSEFYEYARDIVEWSGSFTFDESRPSGVPRRLLDSSLARTVGWDPQTSIVSGMRAAYRDLVATATEG